MSVTAIHARASTRSRMDLALSSVTHGFTVYCPSCTTRLFMRYGPKRIKQMIHVKFLLQTCTSRVCLELDMHMDSHGHRHCSIKSYK